MLGWSKNEGPVCTDPAQVLAARLSPPLRRAAHSEESPADQAWFGVGCGKPGALVGRGGVRGRWVLWDFPAVSRVTACNQKGGGVAQEADIAMLQIFHGFRRRRDLKSTFVQSALSGRG